MLKKSFSLVVLLALLNLTGCVTTASVEGMEYSSSVNQKLKNTSFLENINVNEVSGGNRMNKLWSSQIENQDFKKALENSLQANNLYNQSLKGKYSVNATLIRFTQPWGGLNFRASCKVNYNVINLATHRVIYDKTIISIYTATFDDAAYSVKRLKLANEGAARENIKLFITDLYNR